jgi:hypothetical protein
MRRVQDMIAPIARCGTAHKELHKKVAVPRGAPIDDFVMAITSAGRMVRHPPSNPGLAIIPNSESESAG